MWVTTQLGEFGSVPSEIRKIQIFVRASCASTLKAKNCGRRKVEQGWGMWCNWRHSIPPATHNQSPCSSIGKSINNSRRRKWLVPWNLHWHHITSHCGVSTPWASWIQLTLPTITFITRFTLVRSGSLTRKSSCVCTSCQEKISEPNLPEQRSHS